MKILMKKRSFVKVEMAGLLGVKVPCLMPNRVKYIYFLSTKYTFEGVFLYKTKRFCPIGGSNP